MSMWPGRFKLLATGRTGTMYYRFSVRRVAIQDLIRHHPEHLGLWGFWIYRLGTCQMFH
jgi:hypothetical protein